MAYNGVIFAGTLGDFNVALSASVALMLPLLAQLDLSLFGEFGLGSLSLDLNLQLQAALSLSANISIGISSPQIGFLLALNGILQLEANIQLALSLQLPSVSVDASFQLSFLANFAASISLQLGGLELLIQALLSVKIPVIDFIASLNLSAGPLFAIAFESVTSPLTLAEAGTYIANDFTKGLTSPIGQMPVLTIDPSDQVFGLVLVTKNPVVWEVLGLLMLTS